MKLPVFAVIAISLATPAIVSGQEIQNNLPSETIEENADARYPGESERQYVFEFNISRFGPSIDSEGGLSGKPFSEIFGQNRKMWMFGAELDYEIFKKLGSLSLGLAADYGSVYDHGIASSDGERSPDDTSLRMIPIRALMVYRFDWLSRKMNIPLVPFGKAGLAYTIWWATNGKGVARFGEDKALGGKFGYQFSAGLALELNFIDPIIGHEFDQDFGVNSVYLQAQYVYRTADNFGKDGLNLNGGSWVFGLGFEF